MCSGEPTEVDLAPIVATTSKIRCSVYEDMWKKGHFITAGNKFGGDFLVYMGDPTTFHAAFVIRCIEDGSSKIHPSEIVAFGRLGTSVKKKPVFAYLDDNDKLCYMSLTWLDI